MIPTSIGAAQTRAEGLALSDESERCLKMFAQISQLGDLARLLKKSGYSRCWTSRVTLGAMILAFLLRQKATLEQIVRTLSKGVGDALCTPGKELSRQLARCSSTSAYSQARARLPLPWLRDCLAAQGQVLSNLTTGWQWRSLRVLLLDGTLIKLRSVGSIPRWFPPASNQHGPSYWCQMRVLGCLCLGTGLALAVVIGAVTDSEQAQAVRLILHGLTSVPRSSVLWMGDRNFGVWRVVAAAWQRQSHVLVRLTEKRARRLAGQHALRVGLDLQVCWSPSSRDTLDRALHPQRVPGRLLAVRYERNGFRPEVLLLFTTLTDASLYPPEALAALYGRRWQVELSFRQIKAQMSLGQLEVKSSVMAKRELYAGLMAYNLVRGVMLLSAAHRGVGLQRMSFATAMAELSETLRLLGKRSGAAHTTASLLDMLCSTAGRLLPIHRKPRPPEPRLKRHCRETFPPLHGSRVEARRLLLTGSSLAHVAKS